VYIAKLSMAARSRQVFEKVIVAAVRQLVFINHRGAAAAGFQPRWTSLVYCKEKVQTFSCN
jgi:hypothetical protein